MCRMASLVVLGWIGSDINLNIEIEKSFFESTLNIGSIPETSFLDLIAALAVIPLATFTTLAVLGAGSGDPPEWMIENLELQDSKEKANVSDIVDTLSNTVVAPEVSETLTKITSNDILPTVEESTEEVIPFQSGSFNPIIAPPNEQVEIKAHDDFDFEHFFDGNFGDNNKQPSHDEPSIKGLK